MMLSDIFLTIIFVGILALIAGIFTDVESNILLEVFNEYSMDQMKSNTLKLFRRPVSDIVVFISVLTTLSSSILLILVYLNIPSISAILISTIISVFVQVTYQVTAFNGTVSSHSQHNQPLYVDVIWDNLGHVISRSFISVLVLTIISYEFTLMIHLLNLLPVIALFISLILGMIISIISVLDYSKLDTKPMQLTTFDTEVRYLNFSGVVVGVCYALVLVLLLVFSLIDYGVFIAVFIVLIALFLNSRQEKSDIK